MSSAEPAGSKLEYWALLAACGLLTIWYAYPQLLFSLYAPYEMLRLLFPGLLPDLATAARELLQRLGVAG